MLLGGGGNCQGCGCSAGGCTEFYEGETGVSSTGWVAAGFTTPPGGLTLSSATIYIDSAGTTAALADLRLELYSSNYLLVPNAVVVSLTAPGAIADAMTWTAPDEPLTGSTLYYLVYRVAGAGGSDWKYHEFSAVPGQDPAACELYYSSYSNNGGAGWFPPGPFDFYYLFDIN